MPGEGFTRTINFITTFLKITNLALVSNQPQPHYTAFRNFTAPIPRMAALFTYQFPFVDRRAGLPHAQMHKRTLEIEGKRCKTCAVLFLPSLCVCLERGVNDKWKEVCREVLSFIIESSERKTTEASGNRRKVCSFRQLPNEVLVASPSNHCFVDLLGYVISICH